MFNDIKNDIQASIVVFFVALPLCLGIALASGAPLFSGIIAGIVGGIVVGFFSGSPLGVSGPAAGLAVIILNAINSLESWPAFLLAVFLAGVIQLLLGFAKAGFIAHFFPSSVIKGMLSGIGLLIILKQIPHILGYDHDYIGDVSFEQLNGENTISAISNALRAFTASATLIGIISISILVLWDSVLVKKHKIFKFIQGPVVVVLVGILMSFLFKEGILNLKLEDSQLVRIPVTEDLSSFLSLITFPDFSMISNLEVWKISIVLALVASLETLLCVEATDKLDPYGRVTPTNQELKAQGIGNIISGLIGGLPITQVIVRSSANINFGGKTKLSTIMHGVLLLLSAVTIANILNMIPLSSLAAILIIVGYKLTKPSQFVEIYKQGLEQFLPFIATIFGILTTDLLIGIGIGLGIGVFFALRNSYQNSLYMKDIVTEECGRERHHIVLSEVVSFFNKANIIEALNKIPTNSKVVIDLTSSKSISYDVLEIISNFESNSKSKNISVEKLI